MRESGRPSAGGGELYVVATPVGNLEDMTLRAVRVLKEVGVIACEDTRQTQKLLNHYGITTRTVSYHEHNEAERSAELVNELQRGSSVALVTDAGMPGISDPGFRLISLAIRNQIRVVPVPGASAFLMALVASGLPTDSFCFNGFLPARRSERRSALETIRGASVTQVFYEAPHRIVETLADIVEVLGGQRQVVIGRELTKVHEEFLRGPAKEILETLRARDTVKGEITLLIGKAEENEREEDSIGNGLRVSLRERLTEIVAEDGVDEKTALKRLAKERGVSKSEVYRELQREKK